MLEGTWQDFRQAARSLRRSRAFTAAAVITLALGIGATTAVFAVISVVLLRPLPYRQPERLVMVWQEYVNRGWGIVGVSHANLHAVARFSKTLDAIEGFQPQTISFADGDDAERVEAARVTPGVFTMLGISPAAGRSFNANDARLGSERVVLLGEAFWQRRFGRDLDVLGRTMLLNGEPHRVVGIVPAGSEFPPRFRMTLASSSVTMPAIDVWMPLTLNPDPGRVGFRDTLAIARLAPGATIESARAESTALAAALLREFPGPANTGLTLAINPLAEQMTGDVERPLLLLFAAVALVVLIACANVASMLIARATSRQSETAIRAALGASPRRLRSHVMAECVLLAATSAGLGVGLALALAESMTAAITARIPQFHGVTVDLRLVGFVALLATAVTLVFGAIPAVYTTTFSGARNLVPGAKGVSTAPATALMRRTLLCCEAALAIFLLLGAALLSRGFAALVSSDLGFEPAGKLAAGLTLPPSVAANATQRRGIYEALVSRLGAIPGVQAIGASSNLPLTGDVGTGGLTIAGRPAPSSNERPHAAQRLVDHRYFEVMGMRMVRGRAFTADDRQGAAPVAIINEAAARQFWPDGDPLGQRIRPDGFGEDFWLTIVGVVRDVRYAAVGTPAGAEVYWPSGFTPSATLLFVLRSDVPTATLAAQVRREARRLDARLPALSTGSLDDLVAESVAEPRLLVLLLSLFALFGLAVSASGIYGLASYFVAQRRRDVAIRLALGASSTRVIVDVIAEAVVPVAVGATIGLSAAVLAGPTIGRYLVDVPPPDFATLTTVSLILLGAAAAACCGPALRAARINPLAALKSE